MIMTKHGWLKVVALVAIGVGMVWTCRQATAQQDVLIPGGPTEFTVEPLQDAAKEKVDVLLALAGELADDTPQSEYWLGLQVAALPEVLKKQLVLEDGLAVEEVTQESPAAKAEIKKHDILIKAGDAPLKNIMDLVKAVDGSQGKEIIITIIRDGKNQTIKISPDKRPKTESVETVKRAIAARSPELAGEIKQLEEALEKLKNKVGKDGFGFFFAKPAVVAPRVDVKLAEMKLPDLAARIMKYAEFPKDLSIQINKDGGQPAKIHVKRGDKEWDVTDEKLSELPGEVKQYVDQLLGKAMTYRAVRVSPEGKVEGDVQIAPMPPKPPVPPKPPTAPAPPAPPAKVAVGARSGGSFSIRTDRGADGSDAKLDAILKEVKQLRQEVDELRSKSSADSKK
jgi:PDZ domain